MKIIAGQWGGRSVAGHSNKNLRPTSDKVKEAIFNILEANYITNWSEMRVLDLFAGTGNLGLEALSRGASRAVFVDSHLATTREIGGNLKEFEVPKEMADVICKGVLDGINWLNQRGEKFDLILMDPPYREDWVCAVLNRLYMKPLLSQNGIVVAEHDKRELLSPAQGHWKQINARRFGDTAVTFFQQIK